MIKPLPYWVVPDSYPAFYESESLTAIQMVARLYGKMQEMVDDYNEYVTTINRTIKEFEDGMIEDFECFKNCIIKITNDYIETVDIKINLQDKNIKDKQDEQDEYLHQNIDTLNEQITNAVAYMKTNLINTVNNLINQAIEDGSLQVGVTYDDSTEELNIIVTREGE